MRRQIAIALSMFLAVLGLATAVNGQQPASLVAKADGEGTIKLGKEQFKINAIVVKLFEDGKAEMYLITDITVFVEGTWKRNSDIAKDIDIKITGSSTSNNMDGGGKLFLTEDRKSITGLKLEVLNKISRRVITVNFVAK